MRIFFVILVPLLIVPSVQATDPDLVMAAERGKSEAVRALLDAGADVDQRTHSGGTALIGSTRRGHYEVMQELLDAGAHPNAMDEGLGTALFVAVDHHDEEAVELLLKAGADPNLGTRRSITPLMWTCLQGNVKLAEQLLKAGADPELRDAWGASALFYAVEGHSLAAVELLIRSGADVGARDAADIAAVDFALLNGREEIAARLQQAGAAATVIPEARQSRLRKYWGERMESLQLMRETAAIGDERPAALWEQVPRFPWPPPKPSASCVLSRTYFAGAEETVTFRVVAERLEAALQHAGYFEIKWYAVPEVQGFAMVSRIEQINADGTPKQESSERWSIEVAAPEVFSLASYLKALFTAQRGYFRILVFAVSLGPVTADATEAIDREEALAWIDRGASNLPASMLRQPFTPDHVATALIYEFEQISRDSKPSLREPSPHQGRDHLHKAGVLERLEE